MRIMDTSPDHPAPHGMDAALPQAEVKTSLAAALAPRRPPQPSAIARLLAAPPSFRFHQAVRLLRRWLPRRGPDGQPEGMARLRFRNSLSLAFPPSEIAAIQLRPPETAEANAPAASSSEGLPAPSQVGRIELTPLFMGLLGSAGALPLAYTEQILAQEQRLREPAARAFLDIFQHRAVSLFHEAWRKHRLPLRFEEDRRQEFRPLVLSLAGLGLPGLLDRLQARAGAVADDAIAFYSGLLQQRVVSARHLQAVLSDYFGVPVRLQQFVGRWFTLDAGHHSRLGLGAATLGRDALVGERVWQRDLRARITVGPMSRDQQRRFLPGGPGALALRELLTLATGIAIEYEVHLRLRADAVAPAQLGASPEAGALLGWNAFVLSAPSAVEREEAAYDIHAVA
jgi:type VI secretion system protein ImpH